MSGVYQVPPDAVAARVELHLWWATPHSKVTWSAVTVAPVASLPERHVCIAAVHYRPTTGTTNEAKCAQFATFIKQAGQASADLVVLPETLTYYQSGRSLVECAETIPGDSTTFFGQLSKKEDLYIVAGLVERDASLIYNTAVILGQDGNLVGKYRKVALPRGEIEAGLMPGSALPVFETRFGKIGMMTCYDGFFPQVAQGLAAKGAEIIVWPVWGCNPLPPSERRIGRPRPTRG